MTTITVTMPGALAINTLTNSWQSLGSTSIKTPVATSLARSFASLVRAPQIGVRRKSSGMVSSMSVRKADYKGPAG